MNLQTIKYLSALAKYQHFGKAAQMCFVSQPTLSMQIKKMEESLGVQLLERTNKSVRLTEIGLLLAQYADNILRDVHSMQEAAKSAKDPFHCQLKIGVIPTSGPYLLPKILPTLRQDFPNLSFLLIEKQTKLLLEDLKKGEIDAAILAMPIENKQLITQTIFNEEFLLAVSEKHAWSKRRKINETELSSETLLLLDDGHCLREHALDICYKNNITENQNFRATSLETLRYMVAGGEGITFIPKLAVNTFDGIHYLTFSGTKPSRTLGMVWRKSSIRTLVLKILAEKIRNILLD